MGTVEGTETRYVSAVEGMETRYVGAGGGVLGAVREAQRLCAVECSLHRPLNCLIYALLEIGGLED